MNSFVVGSDKTFFDKLPKALQYEFFTDCAKFFAERYGEENIIAAVVHNDETTPHMHLNLMPITSDGRLCSKQLFDKPQLQKLQTDFYEEVGKKYGLHRGKEGSQRKHLSTAEFKAKKIIEQAETIKQENQVYADALEEAKSGEYSRNKSKLKQQAIAAVAENVDLKNQNEKFLQTLKANAATRPENGLKASSKEIKISEERIERLDKIIESLYEDKVEGKISEERYLKMSKTYETEQVNLTTRVKQLKAEIVQAEEDDYNILSFMSLIDRYCSFDELTPEILRSFIEKVVVHEKTKIDGHYRQTVEIFYNFVGAIDRPIWANEPEALDA